MKVRVKPNLALGLGIWIAYVVLVFLIQIASGIRYDAWNESGYNLFFGGGISLIIASVLLAITASLLRWWKPLIFEKQKSKRRWPIVFPVAMAVLALLSLLVVDWGAYNIAFFGASLVLLLVGFTEEITSRGFLLVGLRTRVSEGWVWFLTSLLFGLMHGINIVLGAEVMAVIPQMLLAFGGGTIFYITRRVTGSLIPAMILHGFWDFSAFAVTHGQISPFSTIINLLYIVVIIAALISVRVVIKDADERVGEGKAVEVGA